MLAQGECRLMFIVFSSLQFACKGVFVCHQFRLVDWKRKLSI